MQIKKKQILSILTLLVAFFGKVSAQHVDTPVFDPTQFVVKLSEEGDRRMAKSSGFFFESGLSIKKIRPLRNKKLKNKGSGTSYLDGIYKVHLDRPVRNLKEILDEIASQPDVIYAEPTYYDKPLLVTNDPLANPSAGSQYYLSLIGAYEAWDITKGDEKIRIAILDSGFDPEHEDIGSIAYNEADPVNGIDDDGNGFTDDYIGWDFANNDNDPTADQDDHGTRVTGVAVAGNDNGVGIAGVGFNTSFVPLKIFTSETGVSSNAYEAIIYAADQGYEIINLSWGSPGSYSQYRQDIINYATLEQGAIIVAAAGNTPEMLDFYPASYDHVLSVGATDETDSKAEFSTFSYKIDMMAPGDKIISTANGDQYTASTGTSFACPQVAAAAALVKARYSDWTNLQIMEQLRVTSDPIDAVAGNDLYANKLGKGRLNVLKALTETNTKSVRVDEFTYSNGSGEYAYYGDTLTVSLELINYLGKIDDLRLKISIANSEVLILDPVIELSTLDSLDSRSVSFSVLLGSDIGNEEQLPFLLSFSGENYNDFQVIEIVTSDDRLDFGIGQSFLTTNSLAELGHQSNIIADGIGFRWQGSRLLENMGLLIAYSPDSVADNVFTNSETLIRDNDLAVSERLKVLEHRSADLYAKGQLNIGNSNLPDLKIEHSYFAWEDPANENNILLKFRMSNNSGQNYDSVYFGLLANWDINTAVKNTSFWYAEDSIAIALDENKQTVSGLALLSDHPVVNYNHVDLRELSLTENTDFSDADKFSMLYNMRTDSLEKTDIAQTLSILIPRLTSGESLEVVFVLTAAMDLSSLQEHIASARSAYDNIRKKPAIGRRATTCKGGDVILFADKKDSYTFYSDPFGAQQIKTDSSLMLTSVNSDTLIYYRRNDPDGTQDEVMGYEISAIPTIASFTMSTDTLYTNEGTLVSFMNTSELTATTLWDLGNGLFTTAENPSSDYIDPGIYEVSLEVTSVFGCKDVVTRELVVAVRSEKPVVEAEYVVCDGGDVRIIAENTDSVIIYRDEFLEERIFSGAVYQMDNITSDQTLFVTNAGENFESSPVRVEVKVSRPEPMIFGVPDTTRLDLQSILIGTDETSGLTTRKWTIDGEDFFDTDRFSIHLRDGNDSILTAVLEAEDSLGCVGTTTRSFAVSPADKPFSADMIVCAGEVITVRPENGQYFAFYTGENDENAVHKGGVFQWDGIQSDTTLYIASIDGYVESERIAVDYSVDAFKISINELPPLDLGFSGQARSVTLSTVNEAAFYYWSVNGEQVERSASPTLFFEEAGEYQISVEAINERGCRSVDSLVLKVMEGLDVILDSEKDLYFNIYPNPTNGVINFSSNIDRVEVLSPEGKILINRSIMDTRLDLGSFNSGIYMVRGWLNGEIRFFQKVILRN